MSQKLFKVTSQELAPVVPQLYCVFSSVHLVTTDTKHENCLYINQVTNQIVCVVSAASWGHSRFEGSVFVYIPASLHSSSQ